MKYDLLLSEDKKEDKIIDRYILSGERGTIKYLSNIKSVNIFVGANNSGKSWMMRCLMRMKSYEIAKVEKIVNLVDDFNDLILEDKSFLQNQRITYGHSVPAIHLNKIQYDKIDFLDLNNKLLEFLNHISQLNGFTDRRLQNYDPMINFQLINILKSQAEKIIQTFKEKSKNEIKKKYYIPTLRTAHSLFDLKDGGFVKIEDDIFFHTLQKNYVISDDVRIFTGLHLYKSILNSRNARKDVRKRFEDFETFVQNNFFDGKKIDIVAEFDKDKSLSGDNSDEIISIHIDGENDTRKLHELGDGIQAIIILMYQIFMAEENSVIFIDEPELNLHPGMQRLFFEQISMNKDLTKKNITYFISTHSNHILDLTLENNNVSIYSFNPIIEKGDKKIIVKNVNAGNNDLLRDLGVNNTSVFLANSSIWVEGISDRNYIKSFLRAYCDYDGKKSYPKEDIDFAFFEYAGGNIEHYIFGEELDDVDDEDEFLEEINTLALSNKIFLLADSDMAKEGTKKYKRLELLEGKFSKNDNLDGLIFWNIRESENLLSIEVWKKILIEFCNKKEINENTQSKIDNYFLEDNELDQTEYIGKLLKKVKESGIPLNEVCKKIQRGKGEEWQTFKDKATLSRVILEKTLNKELTWNDFKNVPEVVELTEKVYEFILKRDKNFQIHKID